MALSLRNTILNYLGSQGNPWTAILLGVMSSPLESRLLNLRGMTGGIGEGIMQWILNTVAADEARKNEDLYREVFVEKLIHGSSLICRSERQEDEERTYSRHRLVRGFVLSDMVAGSARWKAEYTLALNAIHEGVRTELERQGNIFVNFRMYLKAIFVNSQQILWL